jgi:hypothetical protein
MISRVAAIAKTPSANVSSLKRIAEFAEREFGEPG